MLSAYYSKGCDAGGLFAPLKISSVPDYRDKMNRYNVIQIDMNSEYQNTWIKERLIQRLTADIREEMRDQFPAVRLGEEDSLAQCIQKVKETTHTCAIERLKKA